MALDKNNISYRRLDEQDVIKTFDCGDEDLNDFIINDAPLYMFKSYPAIKICRLGTDLKYRGEGIGAMIVNMIIASYQQDNKAGCRFVTVDAYRSALGFYYNLGFLPLSKEDENAETRLLYFDLKQL